MPSKKSVYRSNVSKLDNFGKSKLDFTPASYLPLLEQVCGLFVQRVIKNINKLKDFVVTGAIADIQIQSTKEGIIITANKHLIYQDRGVNGSKIKKYDTPHSYTDKMPPVQVFIDWIRNNNSIHLNDEKFYGEGSKFKELTDEQKIERTAWAMAVSVFQKGFKPRKIYSKEIPRLIKELQKVMADFTVQYIFQNMDINPKGGGGNRVILP